MFKRAAPIICIILGIILGLTASYLLFLRGAPSNTITTSEIRYSPKGYKFVRPLLAIDIPPTEDRQYLAIKSKLLAYINDQIKNQKIDKVSVYFRDINSGNWFGINENARFEPASLLKVPTMMAYYKLAETEPEILSKKIIYKEYSIAGEAHDTLNRSPELKIGGVYTIDDLIRGMIVYSDNNAKDLLIENIDPEYLKATFVDLGIQSPSDTNGVYTISTKTYSLFFRILYNATYLNDRYSEKALKLLVETSFDSGLAASLPDNINLANKFGETPIYNNGQIAALQLHDCGIVYNVKNPPYFICVMTESKSLTNSESIIQNISKITYEYETNH